MAQSLVWSGLSQLRRKGFHTWHSHALHAFVSVIVFTAAAGRRRMDATSAPIRYGVLEE